MNRAQSIVPRQQPPTNEVLARVVSVTVVIVKCLAMGHLLWLLLARITKKCETGYDLSLANERQKPFTWLNSSNKITKSGMKMIERLKNCSATSTELTREAVEKHPHM